jgi:hypothetical protein
MPGFLYIKSLLTFSSPLDQDCTMCSMRLFTTGNRVYMLYWTVKRGVGEGDTGITLRSKQDPIRSNWWLMSKELVLYCDYCGLRPLSS